MSIGPPHRSGEALPGPRAPANGDPVGQADPIVGKVFGLGLARTGTTSLHDAMGLLGLRSAPDSVALLDRIDLAFLARFDAFFDNPIPFRYHELDAVCVDSRFVVTHRPLGPWLASMEWLFGPGLDRLDVRTRATGDRVHRVLYGTDRFDAGMLTELHERHYGEVRSFVSDRPHVWLETDDGLEWDDLCALLGLPRPDVPFPRTNPRRGVGRRWRRRG